ncbi:MAG TPA: hypothetical protein VJC05_04590 [Candidatus Andersenbacteria bacterium]|nr:hypothetical protein [Candidatus Andersenbacteria bacterium]
MNQRGQTLVGVMIATVVLVLLMLGVTGVAVVTTRLLAENKRHTVALGIVNERLEYIRSLPFHDVGFLSEQDGILGPAVEAIAYGTNAQGYTLTTVVEPIDDSFDGTGDDDADEDLLDYKRVTVTASWTTANEVTREAEAVTDVAREPRSFSCAVCPGELSCDASIGACVAEAIDQLTPSSEGESDYCIPGLQCPNGSLCPLSASCDDAEPAPDAESGTACTPGLPCQNGSLCPLSGVCPNETCYDGLCSEDGVCFSNFCYDPDWYELSFASSDWSGPASEVAMMCKDTAAGGLNSCTTTNDCPETCLTDDGVQVIWQCEEQTWVPDCRAGNTGGATPACRGGYDESGNCQSGFECIPEACPAGGYCSVNGKECGVSSSNDECTDSSQCEGGEVCDGEQCRTICPDSEQCRIFWGGYTRGCQAYAITGAASTAGLPQCPDVLGQSEVPTPPAPALPTITYGCENTPTVFEGNSGTTPIPVVVRVSGSVTAPVTGRIFSRLVDASYPGVPAAFTPADQSDFQALDESFSFVPGGPTEYRTSILINGDTFPEGQSAAYAEVFEIRSSNLSNATEGAVDPTCVFRDDDNNPAPPYAYPTPQDACYEERPIVGIAAEERVCGNFGCASYPTVVEGDELVVAMPVILRLIPAQTAPVTVHLATEIISPGSPNQYVADSNDFVSLSQDFTFEPGVDTLTAYVAVYGDQQSEGGQVGLFEKAEYFGLRLTVLAGNAVVAPCWATAGVIQDDD